MTKLETLVQFAKATGYIYQGSEIYNGLANTWDYGPLGSLLKNNIKQAWIKKFIKEDFNNVLVDTSILLNREVWVASGHVSNFSDPLTECRKCHKRYRADNLISEQLNCDVDGKTENELNEVLSNFQIKCPNCEGYEWMPIRAFNMMFKTHQGVVLDSANEIYLRPETAQGIFINFKNIQRTTRRKLPIGVGQIGKSFRNEITPGNFVFRTREFEQMELEFFTKPGTEIYWFKYWKDYMVKWLKLIGIKSDNIKLYDHPEEALSHYSNATTDILYRFPWGFDELWGIASRTDFDLKAHMQQSKQDLTYLDPDTNEKYVPYIIEPSVGVERLVLATLNDAYDEEVLSSGEIRQVLRLTPVLAPYKVAILPLMKKIHSKVAMQIFDRLSQDFDVTYDETANIGKRYRRQDAIGTPICVTIDDETLNNRTVTIRDRDTMGQITLKISQLKNYITKLIKI